MLWQHKIKQPYEPLPKIVLSGPRVYICPPQPEHCMQWINVRKRNQVHLASLEPAWPKDALNPSFFKKRLKRQIQQWKADDAYPFLILKNSDEADTLIGGVNINHVCRGAAQYASLGYWLDRDHQGQGLMSEAMKLILRFSFETLHLHRMNAAVLPDNTKSISLLERNGFKQEGFAEKYIRINGEWQDHILFGLPYERWKNMQATR